MAENPKTLLPDIANSPYFIKYPGRQYSQVLFKPGYPLQSAELISLQNIINEQVKRFGNHIFKDGSLISSESGIDYDDCQIYQLQDGARSDITSSSVNDTIVFLDESSNTILEGKFVAMKDAFVEDGVVYPTSIGLKFDSNYSQKDLSAYSNSTVTVYLKISSTNLVEIGTLGNVTPTTGKYATINDSIFYVSGYFTNIQKQTYIYAVNQSTSLNKEVGIELVWEIIDISDETYGEQLFDPAENAYNENSPGADRLILKLQLTDHELNYQQSEDDWKFVPLLKFKNGNLIYRIKYPVYSVLGETLARRTYEINGNFVVDNFKLTVESDQELLGSHYISNISIVSNADPTENQNEIIYTIVGTDTNYTALHVGNYVMFGTEINYNRLLKIISIDSDTLMRVSNIHYDMFEDVNNSQLLDEGSVDINIQLRDEEKLNYTLSEGKAYVRGYRFETLFETKLQDNKAREYEHDDLNVTTNDHYFNLDSYLYSENYLKFDELELIDIHCTEHKELFAIDIELTNNFANHLTINQNDIIEIDGTKFENILGTVDTSTGILSSIYKIIEYSTNSTDGLPVIVLNYNVTNQTNSTTEEYKLLSLTKIGESPFTGNSSESYSSTVITNNTANTAINGYSIEFTNTGGSYSSLNENDYVTISDGISTVHGYVSNLVSGVSTSIIIDTDTSIFNNFDSYTITKPSYYEYSNYQYNSTKIGTVRINSVGVVNPNILRFSHFKLNPDVKTFTVIDINTNKIKAIDLNLSFVHDVYNGMFIEHNGSRWEVIDYDGDTQEFTLDNVTVLNPLTFSALDTVNLVHYLYNVKSIVKSNINNTNIRNTEYYGNITIDSTTKLPKITTTNQTQKKFAQIRSNGDGEVKSVIVKNYSIFYDDKIWTSTGGNSIVESIDSTKYDSDYNIETQYVKVYAYNDIIDNNTNFIRYKKGELIEVTDANIVNYIFTINLKESFSNGDQFIVHAVIPVSSPLLRLKNLKKNTDTFSVEINSDNSLKSDYIRYDKNIPNTFELKHSDVYRIRSVRVGVGKTNPKVDLTSYFTLDNGQRETHYDHGRLVLKPYLKLPEIVTTDKKYYFEVLYDYFESDNGHYFTVDSYTDIHYRKIPTYIDPAKNKFPLRNVIDFRPVRNPISSLTEYDNETEIVGDVYLEYDYYINKEKIISLQGNGTGEIELQYSNTENYVPSDYNIKLYDLTIPAYTFEFDDIEYKLIDNRNYTMRDISKLQKRIENLEDIAQLNALELQALQTNLTTPSGDPRYRNGLLVDMFSGFSISKVNQSGFACSVDLETMKMYPSFNSNNMVFELSPTSTIDVNFPTIKRNIAFLPIASEVSLVNSITLNTDTPVNSKIDSFTNGKLRLYPINDNWYSTQTKPIVLLNEDSQFKNWSVLGNKGFGTQWNDWEQFWSGVNITKSGVTLANETLSQKIGKLVNNKNNVETIINNKRINNALSFKSRHKRVGFVLQMLKTNFSEYTVKVNNESVTVNAGQRLEFKSSSTSSIDRFKMLYHGYEISQATGIGTATGIINHIEFKETIGGLHTYYLYVTNINSYYFVDDQNINELNGTIISVTTPSNSSTLELDSNGILCGDFVIEEGKFHSNISVDVRIEDIDNNDEVVASNKLYIGGLLETKTNFCQSILPVQRKLFSNSNLSYIDDKTYIINSTTNITSPLHQTFILENSAFISKAIVRCKNLNGVDVKLMATIQPIVNGNLSPSLVLPFSEVIVNIPAGTDGEITIPFEIPVYISSNKEYALTLRTEDSIDFYTTTNNYTDVFVENCITVNTINPSNKVLQMQLYKCEFNTMNKQIVLRPKDDTFNEEVDRLRVNVDSLDLSNTLVEYEWKARNYDDVVKDLEYKKITPNDTTLLGHRKAINQSDFELLLTLSSDNNSYTPMIDLNRLSVTTVEHLINDGKMDINLIDVNRTGTDTNTYQIILQEDDAINGNDRICLFNYDVTKTITNFYSDTNFLLNTDKYTVSLKKYDTANSVFIDYTPSSISKNDNKEFAKLIEDTNMTISIDVDSEYKNTKSNALGNTMHRYYSEIVTLADDFEAMQLYVQMDTILNLANEVYVFYRVLENTEPFDKFDSVDFKLMKLNTGIADKYSNRNAKTLEFETVRDPVTEPRFKYFQVKVCFTTTDPTKIPVTENIRILALDN